MALSTIKPPNHPTTLTTQPTGEYCFYELAYTSAPPPPRGALSLECPVRTYTSAKVSVRNTLDTDVAMTASCSNKQVG
jgi:hydrocephalus-inducing protein